MAQSNVIVTYAPARQTVPGAPLRPMGKRNSKRIGVTLAGALLAGGAAFTLGTFVRPDGTIREPGTSSQQHPRIALPEPASTAARALPDAPADAAAQPPAGAAPSLPYLTLVRDVAPSQAPPPSGAARRMLTAPVAPDKMSAAPTERGRVPLRAEDGPGPVPARIPDGYVALAAPLTPPQAPVPATGQRRDLAGFLSEQGLVLAAETDPQEALAPVSQWTPDDFAAPDDAPPAPAAIAAPARLAAIAEVAPAPGELGVGSDEVLPPPATDALAAEAARVPQLAEAVSPVETTPVAVDVSAGTDPLFATPTGTMDAEAGTRTRGAAPRVASAAITPMQGGAAVAAMPEAAYVQSFPMAVVNGEAVGAITLRDLGPQGSAIHLGALVGLLKLRMPEAEFARLSTAAAAAEFVTLDQLRAAGITVRLDAERERLLIEAR